MSSLSKGSLEISKTVPLEENSAAKWKNTNLLDIWHFKAPFKYLNINNCIVLF